MINREVVYVYGLLGGESMKGRDLNHSKTRHDLATLVFILASPDKNTFLFFCSLFHIFLSFFIFLPSIFRKYACDELAMPSISHNLFISFVKCDRYLSVKKERRKKLSFAIPLRHLLLSSEYMYICSGL